MLLPTFRSPCLSFIAAIPLAFAGAACARVIPPETASSAALPATAAPAQSYADLADLATSATVVARAQVRKVARLKPEQAPGVAPAHARLYIEAQTVALLVGGGLGESISYLADVPLDARGRVPSLKKTQVILFARAVPGTPGVLRLVAPDAQLVWSDALDRRVRALLIELVAPGAPPRITGVREAIHVPGNLAGEGETQISLATVGAGGGGEPVSLTIVRRPGAEPAWGVSFSEIVDQAARPPARDTLAWYRLACFLPATLPDSATIGVDAANRGLAARDYALVIQDLGPCPRNRAAGSGGN